MDLLIDPNKPQDMYKLFFSVIFLLVLQLSFSQEEKFNVEGAIVISDSEATTPVAGTIRWNGEDFQGFDGTQWRTFSYLIESNISDDFAGDGPLNNYTTNNESSLPEWQGPMVDTGLSY